MDRDLWTKIRDEIKLRVDAEPTLGSFLYSLVLSQKDLLGAVSSILASKLHSDALSAMDIKKFIIDVYRDCKGIEESLEEDIKFFKDHDPACNYFSTPLLFYKGFLGLATYRAAHCLWNNDRHTMALFFQNRASEVFGVDIHPAAKIAGGVMIDHATGVVIGETSEIESEVSIFQGVTLGGKGFESGKRHPNIKKGASIFAASTVLGDITVGENAIIAAGSLVLNDVIKNSTVAGVPAKII
ncbi:serine O-acetyltransferase [Gammaproteobacteria bacterium]|nr:serine O-acetyltransferase [Gammaproteobacteria bacterium]|tara:strand:+ start:301 stop:1023 length:723 start_codon:yes stop_codon:yes gene_type:complete